MDAATRAEISLKPSDWKRLGPVFRYMDEQHNQRWTGLTPLQRLTLEPICRLASAMIESPASLAFFHALMSSPRTEITSLSERVGYPCQEFPRLETSSISDSEDPRLALKRLAPNIKWIVVDSEGIAGFNGTTSLTWEAAKIVDNGRNGYQCTIRLGRRLIIDLLELRLQADKTIQIFSQQFLIASVLCHEVAHAFNAAVDPALVFAYRSEMARRSVIGYNPPETFPYCEPFFKDHAQAELGYCWENEVFGGSLVPRTIVENPMEICKWPNPITLGLAPPGRPLPVQRRGSKATLTRYYIPAHFIHSIQQQAFWDRLDPVDAVSLRVLKTTGTRRFLAPGTWQDDEWDEAASSEGDWSMDEENWVYRNEEPDVVARLYSPANHAATTKWLLDLPDPAL